MSGEGREIGERATAGRPYGSEDGGDASAENVPGQRATAGRPYGSEDGGGASAEKVPGQRATAGRPYGSEDGVGARVDEAPPFLGSWRNVYLAVLGTLLGWILIGFWLTAVWR